MAVSSLRSPRSVSEADAHGRDDAEDQRADGQGPAQQKGDDHAGQDGVRQRIAKEGHAAQHDIGSQHGTDDADDDRRQ